MVKFSLQVGQKGRKRFTLGIAIAPSEYHTRAGASAILVFGTAAYLLLAWATDAWVVNAPDGNRFLQAVLLGALSLAFVVAAEGFLGAIGAVPPEETFSWPFLAASVGAVAYSLAWAPSVFVNYWYYDDWGYLRPASLNAAFVLSPLNDHFVPLLKIVIWAMNRAFGFDYIGAACLQQTAFLLIVVVLAHLLWSAARRPWLLVLMVGSFALWPGYGVARTWFAGGFWLTASAALLAAYVLHARQIVFAGQLRALDVVMSALLAAGTVFISSQTLIPAIYLATFCLPHLLLSAHRNTVLRRLVILCAVSLVPTALAFLGRSAYVVARPRHAGGLFNGSVFLNIAVFFLNKVLLMQSFRGWLAIAALAGLFALLIAAAVRKLATSQAIARDRLTNLASLLLGGGVMLALPIIQIGIARDWGYETALNPYYVTLPFLGLWLLWMGSVLSVLEPSEGLSAQFRGSTRLATVAVLIAASLSPMLQRDVPSRSQHLQLIHAQQQFMDSFGTAVCELTRLHPGGPAVHWVPTGGLLNCNACTEIIGPRRFLRDLGFDAVAAIAARRTCPDGDVSHILSGASVTDGNESEAARSFLHTYLVGGR